MMFRAHFAVFIVLLWSATRISTATVVLPKELDRLLNNNLDFMEKIITNALPSTIGACGDKNPPSPCEDMGNLYYDKSTWHRVTARWITGINDFDIESLSVDSDEATHNMQIKLRVKFKRLPMSLKAEACGGFLGCKTLFDNTNACCGNDKVVTLELKSRCHEEAPFIRDTDVHAVSITPDLDIKVSVLGMDVNVKDITNDVENEIEQELKKVFSSDIMGKVNDLLKSLVGDSVHCSTPPPTTAPTPSPTPPETETPTEEPADEITQLPNLGTVDEITTKIPENPNEEPQTNQEDRIPSMLDPFLPPKGSTESRYPLFMSETAETGPSIGFFFLVPGYIHLLVF